MSFDPDNYLDQQVTSSAPTFDPDKYLDHPAATAVERGSFSVPQAAANLVTNVVAAPIAGVRGIYDVVTGKGMDKAAEDVRNTQNALTYKPNPATSEALASNYNPLTWIPKGAKKAGDFTLDTTGSPTAATAVETGINALPMVAGVKGGSALRSAPVDVDAALSNLSSKQSMGAAASSPRLDILPPELQQAVRTAVQQTGGAINPDVFGRHAEAASLPVPMKLTQGQATQDPHLISQEMNDRARSPGMVERLNQQNQHLIDNIQAMRDRVGPDVFSANPVEHGDTLIRAYKDKAAEADANTSAKYQALREAAGGDFPVDAKSLYDNASSALHKQLLFEHAPNGPMAQLSRMAESGSMTFEQFEALRTNLSRIQRTATDGNERYAAGVIRNAMEELPLKGEAAKLKPLADDARATARAQFQAVEADPAYKAAVSDSVPPDRFVQRFITGQSATRDGVETMRENLQHDPVAVQTLGVATLDHLRRAAGINDMGDGNFSQAGFNRALQAQSPKMVSLVDPKTSDQLETLGNVARYTQNQPRGSYVNNSNTAVALFGEHAAHLLEKGANSLTGGIVPVGTMVRKGLENRQIQKRTNQALAPGAGLNRLSDMPK